MGLNLVRCRLDEKVVGGSIYDAYDYVRKVVSKKGHQIFGQGTCTPQRKSWLRLWSSVTQ